MTPHKIAAGVAAAAGALALALPGAAGATAGAHNFEQSYPVASKLCAEVAKGGGPARLHAAAATVLADCATLQNSFNAARQNVLTTEAAIANTLAIDSAALKAACVSKPAHPLRCAKDHTKSKLLHRRLGRQKLNAARAYWHEIEAFRAQFWSEVKTLPGGKELKPDAPIPVQNR
jgi:hypothetical protein